MEVCSTELLHCRGWRCSILQPRRGSPSQHPQPISAPSEGAAFAGNHKTSSLLQPTLKTAAQQLKPASIFRCTGRLTGILAPLPPRDHPRDASEMGLSASGLQHSTGAAQCSQGKFRKQTKSLTFLTKTSPGNHVFPSAAPPCQHDGRRKLCLQYFKPNKLCVYFLNRRNLLRAALMNTCKPTFNSFRETNVRINIAADIRRKDGDFL